MQEPAGTAFVSTLTSLPAHTMLTDLLLTATVHLAPGDDPPAWDVEVDGQQVPIYGGTYSGGTVDFAMDLSWLAHTSDSMTISVAPIGVSGSSTFSIDSEGVALGQDAWISPVQTDASRDNRRPAILDLVRGDDSGTPQALDQPQDIYFGIDAGGTEPGLVQSDGSVTPVDSWMDYADYGITVDGQNDGVTYNPGTARFKLTIPAGQSSVRVDFIPTNLYAEPGVPAYQYGVNLGQDVTDPNTQIAFDLNCAATTNPTTGQATTLRFLPTPLSRYLIRRQTRIT